MTIESFETVLLTCIFIVPGFIIDSLISIFAPPKKKSDGVHFLMFLVYSVVHCAVWSWAYILIWEHFREKSITLFLLILCGTALLSSFILGIVLGLLKKYNVLRYILDKVGFNVSHPTETAWEYLFSKQKSSYVIILLNDDTKVYGWYSSKSFTSSDFEERDIYIEQFYDENWNLVDGNKGIYIAKDQIKTINFYKGADEENAEE